MLDAGSADLSGRGFMCPCVLVGHGPVEGGNIEAAGDGPQEVHPCEEGGWIRHRTVAEGHSLRDALHQDDAMAEIRWH